MQAFASSQPVLQSYLIADLIYPDLRSANANRFASALLPVLRWLAGQGVRTLSDYARCLTALRIKTPRGKDEWKAVTVKRVLVRVAGKPSRIPQAIILANAKKLFHTDADYRRWEKEYLATSRGQPARAAE